MADIWTPPYTTTNSYLTGLKAYRQEYPPVYPEEHTVKSNPELRRIIGEAYDKHTNGEKAMYEEDTIAKEAMRKRMETRAEMAVASVGDYLEGMDWEDGAIIEWNVEFNDTPDKTYRYVALFSGNRWHLTGRSGKLTTNELTELITGLALRGHIQSTYFGDL